MRGRFAPLRLFGVDAGKPRWPTLVLTTETLIIRPPELDDYPAWAALRDESRHFLMRWEPLWPEDDLSRTAFRRRIKRYQTEIDRDESYPFFLFRAEDGRLMGGITLGNVRRGAAQAGTLGYWMGERFAGQGYMRRAVTRVCHCAFDQLGLSRIEAACLPENAVSIHLLEKAGFGREGLARSYLNIAGERRDHILFALLADDVRHA